MMEFSRGMLFVYRIDRGVVSAYPFLYYSLASVYAFKGEKDRAYENLRILNQREMMPSWMDMDMQRIWDSELKRWTGT